MKVLYVGVQSSSRTISCLSAGLVSDFIRPHGGQSSAGVPSWPSGPRGVLRADFLSKWVALSGADFGLDALWERGSERRSASLKSNWSSNDNQKVSLIYNVYRLVTLVYEMFTQLLANEFVKLLICGFTAWMGVFHQSNILMTRIFLKMWVCLGLSESMYLAQIPCGNSPTDLSVCFTLLENILSFLPSQLQPWRLKWELTLASCKGEKKVHREIMWACDLLALPHPSKQAACSSFSRFLASFKETRVEWTLASYLHVSLHQLAERWLVGDAHAQRFGGPWQWLM